MKSLLAILVVALVLVSGYGGYEYGRATEKIAANEKIDAANRLAAEWKGKRDAAQKRYDEQAPALARLTADNAELVGQLQRKPPDTRRASCQALGEAYQGAERDIGRCAADVDRFGREAAEAARSHRALDAAWPLEPSADRKAGRAAREAIRNTGVTR